MVKTRNQTESSVNKKRREKEKEKEDSVPTKGSVRSTKGKGSSSSRITKKKAPNTNNKRLHVQQVNVETNTDTNSLSPSSSKLPNGQKFSQEQINQLIHLIVNDNIPVYKASRIVNISFKAAYHYYYAYKNDPEKKIPLPRNSFNRTHTQQHIQNLITYIENDKMAIKEASAKAGMGIESGRYYYNKYLEDPNHNIPIPQMRHDYTQGQKDEFIGYIINDKMSITAASKKANMSNSEGRKHYHKYFKEQNPDVTMPSHIATKSRSPQEKVDELIGYIVNDKMSIRAASKKADIDRNTGLRHYHRYLSEHDPKQSLSISAQQQMDKLIKYIVNGKMTLRAAAKEINASESVARTYYMQYLKDHNLDVPPPQHITQDRINKLIGYIVDDKMSVSTASSKANVSQTTGYKYYRLYRKNRKHDAPTQHDQVGLSTEHNE